MSFRKLAALAFLLLAATGIAAGQTTNWFYDFDGLCPPQDLSGNNLDGACFGGVNTGQTGQYNDAFSFDGDTGYVESQSTAELDTFTLVAWVYKESTNSDAGRIISGDTGKTGKAGLSANELDGAWKFNVHTTAAEADTRKSVTTTTSYNNGEWHLIAGTYNGTHQVLYVDGQQEASQTFDLTIAENSEPWTVGRTARDVGPEYFGGRIDEPRVYTSALTQTEIESIYNTNSPESESAPSFDLVNPADGETFNVNYGETKEVKFEYGITSSDFDGTLTLEVDGNIEASHSFSSFSTQSWTTNVSGLADGQHTWQLVATSDATGNNYFSTQRTFTVNEASPSEPTVSLDAPADGASFNYQEGSGGANIGLNWSVSGGDENGDSYLYINGTQETSRTFSSLSTNAYEYFTTLSNGTYSWYATAETSTYNKQTPTRTFTVNEVQETPATFTLSNPADGANLTYVEGTGGVNVSFEYGVSAPAAGSVNLTPDIKDQVTHQVGGAGSYSFTDAIEFQDTGTDSRLWKVQFISDDTGNIYDSNTLEFYVTELAEQPPNYTINNPSGTLELYPVGWTDRGADFSISWAGAEPLNVKANVTYPNGYEEQVLSGLQVAPASSRTFDETFTISNESARELGQYQFELIGNSTATGNQYVSTPQNFTVDDTPIFELTQPGNDETVNANDGTVEFSGKITGWLEGDYTVQVKKSNESSWTEIRTGQKTQRQQIFNFEATDGTPYNFDTGNHDWRITFENTNNETFTSSSNTFEVVKLSFIESVVDWLLSIIGEIWNYLLEQLGEGGRLFLGLALVAVFAGIYTSLADTTDGVELVAAATMVINSLAGLWPGWLVLALFVIAAALAFLSIRDGGG